jgi:hypothetical protein
MQLNDKGVDSALIAVRRPSLPNAQAISVEPSGAPLAPLDQSRAGQAAPVAALGVKLKRTLKLDRRCNQAAAVYRKMVGIEKQQRAACRVELAAVRVAELIPNIEKPDVVVRL